MFIIMFFFLITISYAYITFDTNLNTVWNKEFDGAFRCYSGGSVKNQTISFSQTFENIPQVFIILEKYDIDSQTLTGYNFSITSITKTNFSAKLECNTLKNVYRVNFQWYAYDDQRIQVINVFGQVPENKTFPRINANADTYFVSLHGVQLIGAVEFEVKVDTINATSVSIIVTNPSNKLSNLKTIGYSLVLGVAEAFVISDLIISTDTYYSPGIPVQTGKKFLVPFVGITFGFNLLMEAVKTYLQSTDNQNNQYQYYNITRWDSNVQFTATRHKYIWVVPTFSITIYPMKCTRIRTSSFIKFSISPQPQFTITLYSQVYSTVGVYNLFIDKVTPKLNIIINHACTLGTTVYGSFLKCSDCMNNLSKLKSFCHGQVSTVFYDLTYQTQYVGYQELQLVITTTNVQIIQTVYNKYKEQSTILSIQIQ